MWTQTSHKKQDIKIGYKLAFEKWQKADMTFLQTYMMSCLVWYYLSYPKVSLQDLWFNLFVQT